MRQVMLLGWGTLLLVACGGSVETAGTGGHGGAGSTTASSSSSSSSGVMSSSSSSSGSVSSSSGSASSSSSGSPGCSAATCAAPFVCCGDACVNPDNDIFNCGTCANKCGGAAPYCDLGKCGTPPCTSPQLCGAAAVCCGTSCCQPGEICCNVPGPVDMGPKCQAPDPITNTCDKGCPNCVCASPDTPIATPTGDRPIADLRPGDLVYSVDRDAVVVVPVVRVNRAPVQSHRVVRVTLATGAVLQVSAPHPTADGRTFGDLRAGGTLDGIAVTAVEIVPYAHPFTYDILPGSSTGAYYAAGALIGSTLPR